MKLDEMKFLGVANGWNKDPMKKKICRALQHPIDEESLNSSRTYHRYSCKICRIYWEIDSSD